MRKKCLLCPNFSLVRLKSPQPNSIQTSFHLLNFHKHLEHQTLLCTFIFESNIYLQFTYILLG